MYLALDRLLKLKSQQSVTEMLTSYQTIAVTYTRISSTPARNIHLTGTSSSQAMSTFASFCQQICTSLRLGGSIVGGGPFDPVPLVDAVPLVDVVPLAEALPLVTIVALRGADITKSLRGTPAGTLRRKE
ncbi:hypothetical protein PCANC_15307 [Puccinia coronata f. sp. avenae]|uniref:Uncharacterized protein n=1 Tax=Puccinia coronata f. sp. avenae TaxID=200324 RepID=A0A2N5TXI2_9BASI|nr:hypothetical protein PCASD_17977 [Puccinia coronata f. sp. avenae]PLW30201.1 hypothetical protein PCASD_18260 [Puccinia coronata f. sp. avenae]PLW39299.1 hypothetical protein PCANC_15307 [Puccinia coronata f. sp. avenae]